MNYYDSSILLKTRSSIIHLNCNFIHREKKISPIFFSEAVYMRVIGDSFFIETSVLCVCVSDWVG